MCCCVEKQEMGRSMYIPVGQKRLPLVHFCCFVSLTSFLPGSVHPSSSLSASSFLPPPLSLPLSILSSSIPSSLPFILPFFLPLFLFLSLASSLILVMKEASHMFNICVCKCAYAFGGSWVGKHIISLLEFFLVHCSFVCHGLPITLSWPNYTILLLDKNQ